MPTDSYHFVVLWKRFALRRVGVVVGAWWSTTICYFGTGWVRIRYGVGTAIVPYGCMLLFVRYAAYQNEFPPRFIGRVLTEYCTMH